MPFRHPAKGILIVQQRLATPQGKESARRPKPGLCLCIGPQMPRPIKTRAPESHRFRDPHARLPP
jgi:hypothetical protein